MSATINWDAVSTQRKRVIAALFGRGARRASVSLIRDLAYLVVNATRFKAADRSDFNSTKRFFNEAPCDHRYIDSLPSPRTEFLEAFPARLNFTAGIVEFKRASLSLNSSATVSLGNAFPGEILAERNARFPFPRSSGMEAHSAASLWPVSLLTTKYDAFDR